jgi:hypothetical protein
VSTAKIDADDVESLRKIGALPPAYTPTTEIGWQLVRLRAKSLASGAKLLSDRELEEKIGSLRD